ncbi:hypothetical protein F5Y19DRAFT_424595 [Xylariaceae sp. FL1651]|nr:hypothetical protein F5Y19DRAFT_424595 [Xylariaceae sp. FL1651]
MAANSIHFRVLAHYRDHGRSSLPGGVYGSRMDSLDDHRWIDIGLSGPIVVASLASRYKLNAEQYRGLCKASVLVNDLFGLRSDAMRKQRENPVLRGMSSNMCEYISGRMRECIDAVAAGVEKGEVTALVLLGFCNWILMASHHKIYECVTGSEEFRSIECCDFGGRVEFRRLLNALEPLGTTPEYPPDIRLTRAELESRYCRSRVTSKAHLSWLADAARTLLNPDNMRPVVDLGHYRWNGDEGDVDFCP